jgi:hypothetical protein
VADGDARQEQPGRCHPAAASSEGEDQGSGGHRAEEGRRRHPEPGERDAAAQGDDEDGAEGRAEGEAQHDGVGQRVGHRGLEHRAGHGQARADQAGPVTGTEKAYGPRFRPR